MLEKPRFGVLFCALLSFLCACSSTTSSSTSPGKDWPTAAPETQGFDSNELADAVERIGSEGLPIDSVQVVRNGVLILDSYFYPYLGDRPHDVASVTKSVTSTLIGIAVDEGALSLEQKVWESFSDLAPTLPSDEKSKIELRHLLGMTSGLDCGRSPGEPELYEMLGSENYVKYALELPIAVAPETEFAYCSPGSHLLSAMVERASGEDVLDFARKRLFDPMDMSELVWPSDPQGVRHGWGDLQLHPRDMARIGHLFLNQGAWNDEQLVSKEWVRDATRSRIIAEPDGTGYGYQWWILAGSFEGVFEARGRGGQAIVVWPDKNVVAVFTGRGLDVRGDIALVLAAALKSDEALPPNPEAYARLTSAIRNAIEPPAPTPVPPLPPMASEVSGKVYRLTENQFDVRCIALQFDSPSEVSFHLTVSQGSFEMPVGMDGVPRFSESGPTGIPVGLLGRWSEATVFSLQYDEVSGPNHLEIEGDFAEGADTVTLLFSDPSGHFPPQSVPGAAAISCD